MVPLIVFIDQEERKHVLSQRSPVLPQSGLRQVLERDQYWVSEIVHIRPPGTWSQLLDVALAVVSPCLKVPIAAQDLDVQGSATPPESEAVVVVVFLKHRP